MPERSCDIEAVWHIIEYNNTFESNTSFISVFNKQVLKFEAAGFVEKPASATEVKTVIL